MTVLVTGGAGFIGGHVVDALLAAGERVRVLDLNPPLDRHAGRVEAATGSITDTALVEEAVCGVRHVFNMAGIAELWVPEVETYQRTHVDGTQALVRACERAGVERLLHLSSAMVLVGAETPIGDIVDGSRDPGERALFGDYARSKWRAESIALGTAGASSSRLDRVALLPTLPMGPGDTSPTPPGRLIDDLFHGRLPLFLDTRLNIIDVRDLAAMIVAARTQAQPGQRYLLAGHDLASWEFLEVFRQATGRRVPTRGTPAWLARFSAHVSEAWACRIGGRAPRASLAGVEMALRKVRFDGAANRALLGCALRPLSETLIDSVADLWPELTPSPAVAG